MHRDNPPPTLTGDGRIPIFVGITGHRDLRDDDLPRLTKSGRHLLSELRTENPSSPLVLLSSLAEGADRLAAHVALECGFELIVPLPMEVTEYMKDFKTEKSRDEFVSLLGKARLHFVVPNIRDIEPDKDPAPDPRDWDYARAGHYIVRQCHILLALWDGNPAKPKLGGTSQMVHYKLRGLPYRRPPEGESLIAPEAGTVFHVVTPRASNPEPAFAYETERIYPKIPEVEKESDHKSTPRKSFDSLLAHAESYNRNVLRLKGPKAHLFKQSRSYIQPGPEFGKLDPALQELIERFAAADALALIFQKSRHFCLWFLCALVVPISLCLAGYHADAEKNLTKPTLWLGSFWLFVLSGTAVFFFAWSRKVETKHLDYRALAEGLRVLFFWRITGTDYEVGRQYMQKHLGEVGWIRLAIWASEPMPPPKSHPSYLSKCVLKHWLIDQRNYFRSAAARSHRRAYLIERWTKWLTVVALVISCIVLMVHLSYYFWNTPPPEEVYKILYGSSLFLVFLLACAGAVAALAEKMAYAQIAKQFNLMYRTFKAATEAYENCFDSTDEERASEILHSLGQEALRESGDWMLLHRERPMEMKFGG